MPSSVVGFFVRITPELRERIEVGRHVQASAQPSGRPPSTQAFVGSLIEAGLAAYEHRQIPPVFATATAASLPTSGVSIIGWGQPTIYTSTK